MSLKGITTLTALAVAAALGFSGSANASYTYATLFQIGNPGLGTPITPLVDSTSGTPAVITYTGQPSIVEGGAGSLAVGELGVSNSGATMSFTANYTIEVTITNNSATSSFYIFGTLSGTTVTSNSGTVNNVYNGVSTANVYPTTPANATSATLNIGGTLFTLTEAINPPPNQNFQQPTVGGGPTSGGFSANVTLSTAVPEPASAVMVGLGLGGVGLVCLSNRRVRV